MTVFLAVSRNDFVNDDYDYVIISWYDDDYTWNFSSLEELMEFREGQKPYRK